LLKKFFSKIVESGPSSAPKNPQEKAGDRPPQPSQQQKRNKSKSSKSSRRNSRSRRSHRADSPHSANSPAQKPWSVEDYQVEPKSGFARFHDLHIPDEVLHAIADLGFEYCSPIQAQVLPYTLDGYDAVGKAQTGTGKTAAFLITVINDLLNNPGTEERYLAEPRALVIAPTRELVMQIGKDARDLCKHSNLNVEVLIGGANYQAQHERLQKKVVDIVAATPGRLIDFLMRGHISLGLIDVLVLDEADRMLDMGFLPQVRKIVRATPRREQRQTLLFSATFNYDVNTMIESWMVDPVRIEIEPETVAADSVEQKIYMVSSEDKFSVLKNIINGEDVSSVIVFANRRDQTRRLFEKLQRSGVSCGVLSGEVAQHKRTRTLEQFKSGKIKVLVATDVAGRGIHIDDVSHVVNYNLPEDPEDYVHRIGRTGRAGATGVSISLACEDDAFMLPDIETMLGKKLECEQPPEQLLS